MATTIKYPPSINGIQKTLDAALLSGVTASMTLNNVTSIQDKTGVCVIDAVNANGTATPAKREYVIFTGVSGSTLTGLTRNADGGSSDQDHAVGAIVQFVPDVLQQQAILDALLLLVDTDGALDTTKVVDLTTAQTLTNKTLTSPVLTTPQINDTSADHQYIFAGSELTADRTVTLPLLTSNDEFTFNAHTQTLTNKRITRRVATTTDDATAEIDIDTTDEYELSAIANATTFTTTGTPTDGQTLVIRFKDAGVSKALTFTGFTAIGVTLPTATTANKWHYIGCKYNLAATAWHVIAVGEEA